MVQLDQKLKTKRSPYPNSQWYRRDQKLKINAVLTQTANGTVETEN
jgi:hypothetical protein